MGSALSRWADTDEEGEDTEKGPHIPTERDIKLVQEILVQFLPLELANLIIDEAEYWPVLACNSGKTPIRVEAMSNLQYSANHCYYISPRLPNPTEECLYKLRKIVFRLWSRDQGWGGDPGLTEPYAGSWTWFEAAIIRGLKGDGIDNPNEVARHIQDSSTRNASDKANPEDVFQVPNPWRSGSKVWHLQRNVRASPQEALHEITWTDRDDPEKKEETTEALHTTGTGWGYGFVRELTPGDRIAIYARAQYPGWQNHVNAVEIRMYYSM